MSQVFGVGCQHLISISGDLDDRTVDDVSPRGLRKDVSNSWTRLVVDRPFVDSSKEHRELHLPRSVSPDLSCCSRGRPNWNRTGLGIAEKSEHDRI